MNALRKWFLVLAFTAVLVVFTSVFPAQANSSHWLPDLDHPAWIYYQLGLYDQQLGEQHSAVGNFSMAISLAPQMTEAYESRGDSYVALQLYDLAIADYTRVLTLSPTDTVVYAKRAYAYAACGDLADARRDFDQISDPTARF